MFNLPVSSTANPTPPSIGPVREWLEADGLGGYASGTSTSGIRTRRYHSLLTIATRPPVKRAALVNGFDAWVQTAGGHYALTSQIYDPRTVHPDGRERQKEFSASPWPRWLFRLEDGTEVEHELFMPKGSAAVVLRWRLVKPKKGTMLTLRPFLSGRDHHSLHRSNSMFSFDPYLQEGSVQWNPYDSLPAVGARFNGTYHHQPFWYRNFHYLHEEERGFDSVEDLASPGYFRWDLGRSEAVIVFYAKGLEGGRLPETEPPIQLVTRLRAEEETRRAKLGGMLDRAADAFLVRRGSGLSIMAGYPWFTDWGRDAFVSLRGLCLSTGRQEEAGQILKAWAETVSDGQIPNLFPDAGTPPAYNAVDASLWFVLSAADYLARFKNEVKPAERQALTEAIVAIVRGHVKGTRHGVRLDSDGLLRAGEAGLALTWMDAISENQTVTPRIGKPVEVQALWLNALAAVEPLSREWKPVYEKGRTSFQERFWNAESGCLYDVVDSNHAPGELDARIRPNQIFAVGGLPLVLLDPARARSVVDVVENRLWTPLGLRSLDPSDRDYRPRYEGGERLRDASYHQGTVWLWLAAAFIEAWIRVRGDSSSTRNEAGERFLTTIRNQAGEIGLGHLPEIADGEPPHLTRGCPFQAWSLAELIRLERDVLKQSPRS